MPALLTFLLVASSLSFAQTITNLAHPAPDGGALPFQMTDGTVIVQGYNENDWWKLTPDINGSYVNGTWTQLASLPAGYVPLCLASAVLADGRLLIEGGEYNQGRFAFTSLGAIYDPVANTWTPMPPPTGWDFIGDSPSSVMPNSKFMIGQKFTEAMAWLDPATLTWTSLGSSGKSDWFAEEGWTLMPDGTILTVDVLNNPNSERYITNQQIGCQTAAPSPTCRDRRKWAASRMATTRFIARRAKLAPLFCVLTAPCLPRAPPIPAPAPDIPHPISRGTPPPIQAPGQRDRTSPTMMMPATTLPHCCPTDTCWCRATAAACMSGMEPILNQEMYGNGGSLMVLPTGQVLLGGDAVYTSTGNYLQPWAPYMYSVPTTATRGQTYLIQGRQLNGMSQAAGFGDEYETATNYPLVRIVNNATGHVFYAKTHGHSSMGVATGNAPMFTRMDIPSGMETGASKLYVVANGIPSTPYPITIN